MSVMIVTGASSGIGRALALRAARAGYDVVAIGRNREALAVLEERVRAEHARIVVDAIDVSDPANAARIVALAQRTFGRIDVLVNNAGHVAVGALAAQSDDALRAQFATHVIGPIALVREALPLLRASRGHVFMLGSGVARVPVGGLGAYAPAKAATRSATAILRRELKPEGIAVTYVDPGAVDTAFMTRAGLAGAPPSILASPEAVARKILAAVTTRPRTLNAVPWQTAAVALAELFPRITDFVLERSPELVGTQDVPMLRQAQHDTAATAAAPDEDGDTATPMLRQAQHDTGAAAVRTDEGVPDEAEAATITPDAAPTPNISPTADAATPNVMLSLSKHEPPGAPAEPKGGISFEDALESVRRRMERVKLSESFVRGLLVAGSELDPGEVALQWAGMPNKNERAATIAVLDALADGGFLAREGERYRVVRTPS
ncbi:MAG TPA: SDR family NAD(P)-dependent oxidoreductase [Candidatus Limnocylindria bacterium]|nr:SDR family NAD(P)-dependent oxidoreductase [Candidatus Limnocylindria bacterium]